MLLYKERLHESETKAKIWGCQGTEKMTVALLVIPEPATVFDLLDDDLLFVRQDQRTEPVFSGKSAFPVPRHSSPRIR